jgi:hypothetical protein
MVIDFCLCFKFFDYILFLFRQCENLFNLFNICYPLLYHYYKFITVHSLPCHKLGCCMVNIFLKNNQGDIIYVHVLHSWFIKNYLKIISSTYFFHWQWFIRTGPLPPKIFLYINKTKQNVFPASCTHKNENILHKIANFWWGKTEKTGFNTF